MLNISRSAQRIVTALIGVLLGSAVTVMAADAPCHWEWPEQRPADGTYLGTFSLSYRMIPGGSQSAKASINFAWKGQLDFVLASERETSVDAKYKKRVCSRTPLGQKRQLQAGCDAAGNVIGSGWQLVAIMEVEAPTKPHILGRATASMQSTVSESSGKQSFNMAMPTRAPVTLKAFAEVGDQLQAVPYELKAIALMGSQGLSLATSFSASGGSSSVKGSGTVAATGASQGTAIANDNGHISEGKWAGSGSDPSGGEKRQFRLKVWHTSCWQMQGTVDTDSITAGMQGTGMAAEDMHSEWEATLQERDIAFEREVERFVTEPVPAKLTWAYVDQTIAQFEQLVSNKTSDYRICVASKAVQKAIALEERELQVLIADYPKVSQGATAAVLCSANQRLLGLMHDLQILADNCPLLDQATQLMQSEWDVLQAKLHGRANTFPCTSIPNNYQD